MCFVFSPKTSYDLLVSLGFASYEVDYMLKRRLRTRLGFEARKKKRRKQKKPSSVFSATSQGRIGSWAPATCIVLSSPHLMSPIPLHVNALISVFHVVIIEFLIYHFICSQSLAAVISTFSVHFFLSS